MKRWSLDARSRRRKPQALCGGGEENSRIPRTGENVDKFPTHREFLLGLAGFIEQNMPFSILSV